MRQITVQLPPPPDLPPQSPLLQPLRQITLQLPHPPLQPLELPAMKDRGCTNLPNPAKASFTRERLDILRMALSTLVLRLGELGLEALRVQTQALRELMDSWATFWDLITEENAELVACAEDDPSFIGKKAQFDESSRLFIGHKTQAIAQYDVFKKSLDGERMAEFRSYFGGPERKKRRTGK
jgi:hypothetical protein